VNITGNHSVLRGYKLLKLWKCWTWHISNSTVIHYKALCIWIL